MVLIRSQSGLKAIDVVKGSLPLISEWPSAPLDKMSPKQQLKQFLSQSFKLRGKTNQIRMNFRQLERICGYCVQFSAVLWGSLLPPGDSKAAQAGTVHRQPQVPDRWSFFVNKEFGFLFVLFRFSNKESGLREGSIKGFT